MATFAEIPWSVAAGLLGIGGGGGLVGALLTLRRDRQSSQQALIKLAQEIAEDTVKSLRQDVSDLRAESKELKDEAARLRQDGTDQRRRITGLETDLAAERKARTEERHRLNNDLQLAIGRAERAEGRIRGLEQHNDSLTRQLRVAGVEVPDPPTRSSELLMLGDPAA